MLGAENPDAVSRTFRPDERVRQGWQYKRVYARGKALSSPHFKLTVAPSEEKKRRLGLAISKKVGSAVRRNRIKRLVREVFRTAKEQFPENCDVVVSAKAGAVGLSYADVLQEITQTLSLWRKKRAK